MQLKSFPHGVALFCDDVRQEISGQHTYVGVYGNRININSNDQVISLPTFVVVSNLVIPNDYKFKKCVQVIKINYKKDKSEEILCENEFPKPEESASETTGSSADNLNLKILAVNGFTPFLIKEDLTVSVLFYLDDFEVEIGSMEIVINDSTSQIEQNLSPPQKPLS